MASILNVKKVFWQNKDKKNGGSNIPSFFIQVPAPLYERLKCSKARPIYYETGKQGKKSYKQQIKQEMPAS